MTLATYLLERWLPHQRTRVRARTALRYEQFIRSHIIRTIGTIPLAKLRLLHVQMLVDDLVTRGLAARTTAAAYRTLHGALAQAVRWQLLGVNPAASIRPPRAERSALQVPDVDTIGRVLAATHGSPLELPLSLITATGMRRGEALGLRWRDVDLAAGRIRVTTSLQAIDGELFFLEPKTDRSRRSIGLAPSAVALLRRHRAEQLERRLLVGRAWVESDVVVDRGDGAPVSPDALSQSFYRLAHALALPSMRLHDFRHAFATTLLAAGVHPKVVSEALGHSSVAFTMDVYQHLMPDMQDAAARAVESTLGALVNRGESG